MKNETTKYTINFHQKNNLIKFETCSLNTPKDSGKKDMEFLSKAIIKTLEKLVIDSGWVTTFSGVFAIAYAGKKPVLMIAYKPSFNFQEITNSRQMWDHLQMIGSKVKL